MKNLKQSIALLFVLFSFSGMAQEQIGKTGQPRPPREKVAQLKIDYFTKELELTAEQSEKFWPVYNEMNDKIRAKRKEARLATEYLKTNEATMTESEAKTKSEEILNADIEQAKLKKEYHDKIAVLIGYKKATKLLSLEHQFKRELLQRLTDESEPDTNE